MQRIFQSLFIVMISGLLAGCPGTISGSVRSLSPFYEVMTVEGGHLAAAINQNKKVEVKGGAAPFYFEMVQGVGSIDQSGNFISDKMGSAIIKITDATRQSILVGVEIVSGLRIYPSTATVSPGNILPFAIEGGRGPYIFSIKNGSGEISQDGLFIAPATVQESPIEVQGTDSAGSQISATVTMKSALNTPSGVSSVSAGQSVDLSVANSEGIGQKSYTVIAGDGSVDPNTGQFTSGANNGTSIIRILDEMGNETYRVVNTTGGVDGPLKLSPVQQFVKMGDAVYFAVSGGVAPYSFTKQGPGELQTSGTFVKYIAGQSLASVTIKVKDAQQTEAQSSLMVVAPLQIQAEKSKIGRGEAIALTVIGGRAPFTFATSSGSYNYDTGVYTAPMTDGSVSISVRDALGDMGFLFFTIAPNFRISPEVANLTAGQSLKLAALDGEGPYSSSIVEGEGTLSAFDSFGVAEFNSATAGTTKIRVADSKGNEAFAQFYVDYNANLSLQLSASSIPLEGKTILTVNGGSAPFTVSPSSGLQVVARSEREFEVTGKSIGTGILQVTDSLSQVAQVSVTVVSLLGLTPSQSTLSPGDTLSYSISGGSGSYVLPKSLFGRGQVKNFSAGQFQFEATPNLTGSNAFDTIEVQDSTGQKIYAQVTVLPSATGGVGTSQPSKVVISSTSSAINTATCSAAIQIELRDSNNQLVTTSTNRQIDLSHDGQNVDFFTDSLCTSNPVTSVTLNAGGGQKTFYFKSSAAQSFVIFVQSTGLVGSSQAQVVNPGPLGLNKISIVLAENNSFEFIANGGLGPYSFSKVSGVGSISATGVYTAPADKGSASAVIRVTDSNSALVDATVVIMDEMILSQTSLQLAVTNSFAVATLVSGGVPPYSYSVQTPSIGGSISLTTGSYLAPSIQGNEVVVVTDSVGNQAALAVTVHPALSLSATSLSIFPGGQIAFSASGGVTPYAFSVVSSGGGTINGSGLYTAPSTVGLYTVKLTDARNNQVTSDVNVNLASTKIVFTTSPQTVSSGDCSGALTAQLQNAASQAVVDPVDHDLVLSTTSLTMLFYASATCSGAPVDRISILAGNNSGTVYFKDTKSGTPLVTGMSSGYAMISQLQIINPGSPAVLVLSVVNPDARIGVCTGLSISVKDNFNNLSVVSANITLNSTGTNYDIYTDSNCLDLSNSFQISAGQATRQNYFKTSSYGAIPIVISSSGLSTGMLVINSTTGPAHHLEFSVQPAATATGGEALTTAPVVRVLDDANQVVSSPSQYILLGAYSNSDCSTLSNDVGVSLSANPMGTTQGLGNFSNLKLTGVGTVYLKASSGYLVSTCSSAVTVTGDYSLSSIIGPANIPSDNLAEATILVVPKYGGKNIGAGKVVEINVNQAGLSFVNGSACRTPVATCQKAVDEGTGAYSLKIKTSTVGAYSLSATYVDPGGDIVLPGNLNLNADTAAFTTLTANTTLTSPTHDNLNLYIKSGTITFDLSTKGKTYGDIFVTGGILNHPTTTTSQVYRLEANVRSFTMNAGSIDVNSRGYPVGYSIMPNDGVGTALAAATQISSWSSGGAHIGRGGDRGIGVTNGITFDDLRNPYYPGGGSGPGNYANPGGGVVRLTSTRGCVINSGAVINANGGAGGAGGSIYFNCAAIYGTAGTNSLLARGGTGVSGAGGVAAGGGGAIALITRNDKATLAGSFVYPNNTTEVTTLVGKLSASAGDTLWSVSSAGGAGSIYLKHSEIEYGSVIFHNANNISVGYEPGTELPSISGTISTLNSANNVAVAVTSSPALSNNTNGLLNGLKLRVKLSDNKGTANYPLDDQILQVTNTNSNNVALSADLSGVSVGESVRSIYIFDHMFVGGGTLLTGSSDIYSLKGSFGDSDGWSMDNGFVQLANGAEIMSPLAGIDLVISGGSNTRSGVTKARNLVINNGTQILPRIELSGSLTINNGTITTNSIVAAGDFNMLGGTLKHETPVVGNTIKRLSINVQGSFSMNGGSIDVSSLGYPAGYSYAPNDGMATTLASNISIASWGNGGSHIGRGGERDVTYGLGVSFDNPKDPLFPGGGSAPANYSGSGGGVVHVYANGACNINGIATIKANGGNGAAGGSIKLDCNSLSGNLGANSIQANGGGGAWATGGVAPGGGGAIAIISRGDIASLADSFAYPTSQAAVSAMTSKISARGGTSGDLNVVTLGGAGSLYLKHSGLTHGSVIFHNGGSSSAGLEKHTELPSLVGTYSSIVNTNSVNVNVTSSPTLSSSSNGILNGIIFRGKLSDDNGTPLNPLDDLLFTVTSSTGNQLTVNGNISSLQPGESFRSIWIFDHLYAGGGAIVTGPSDIYSLKGNFGDDSTWTLTDGLFNLAQGASVITPLTGPNITLSSVNMVRKATVNTTNLSINGGSHTFEEVNSFGEVSLNAGTLTVHKLTTVGNFNINGGTLKHQASSVANGVKRLIVNVGANFAMLGGSIDVSGLGYPVANSLGTGDTISTTYASNNAPASWANGGSHIGRGGLRNGGANLGITYDDVADPNYPGGGVGPGTGSSSGVGGGVVRVFAQNSCSIGLGSIIKANGGYPGGAGGSIKLDCAAISANLSASAIQVNGGNGFPSAGGVGPGGGGAIAIISRGDAASLTGTLVVPSSQAAVSTLIGKVQAFGGVTEGVGGAGSIYIKHSGMQYGSLIFHNNGNLGGNSTELLSVAGTVQSVTASNIFSSSVTSSPALSTGTDGFFKNILLRPDVAASNGTANNPLDDGLLKINTTINNFIQVDGTLPGNLTGKTFRTIYVLDRLFIGGGAILRGASDFYVLSGNFGDSLTYNMTDGFFDLSGGAKFMHSTQSLDLTVAANSTLSMASLDVGNLTVNNGTLTITNLNLLGGLSVNGGSLASDSISTQNSLFVTGGTLTSPIVDVIGNLSMSGGTLITNSLDVNGSVLLSGGTLKHQATSIADGVKRLIVNVGQNFTMSANGLIDVSGLGYTYGKSWGMNDTVIATYASNSAPASWANGGSHIGRGGLRNGSATLGVGFDNPRDPNFPGGGAGPGTGSSTGSGGGVFRLNVVGTCDLNDSAAIRANGASPGGAGGSIKLECQSLGGTLAANAIQSNGANGYTSSGGVGPGGGGAIAIISRGNAASLSGSLTPPVTVADVNSLVSKVQSYGGTVEGVGGAGSIYIKHSDLQYGYFIIHNANRSASNSTEPSGIAGSISTLAGANSASVVTSSEPAISLTSDGLFNGIRLRPDVSNNYGTPNTPVDDGVLTISSSLSNTLSFSSAVPSSAVGKNFRSLYVFEKIFVGGGAVLRGVSDYFAIQGNFGDSTAYTLVDGLIDLSGGSFSSSFGEIDVILSLNTTQTVGDIVGRNINISSGNFTVNSLSASGNLMVNSGTITANLLHANGNITIANGTITSPRIETSGNLQISGGTITANNVIDVGGSTDISGGTIVVNKLDSVGDVLISGTASLSHETMSTLVKRFELTTLAKFTMNGGAINVTGKGYATSYSWAPNDGTATTFGSTQSAAWGSGGSHIGRGQVTAGVAGQSYDNVKDPNFPGAGPGPGTNSGGRGGGVIKILATGLCEINTGATLVANGATGSAGGTINLKCAGFKGTAGANTLTAKGGAYAPASGGVGGGGGGAIALISSGPASSFADSFALPFDSTGLARIETNLVATGGYASAGSGTVFLKHSEHNHGALYSFGTAGNTGLTQLVTETANSNTIFTKASSSQLNITNGSTPMTSKLGMYKNMHLTVYPTAGSVNPFEPTSVVAILSGNTDNSFIAEGSPFASLSINNDHTYRSTYKFDTVYVDNGVTLEVPSGILILDPAAGVSCDSISPRSGANTGAFAMPSGSKINGLTYASVLCPPSQATTQGTSLNFTNYFGD